MPKLYIKKTEMFRNLLEVACDNMCFENEGINKETHDLYGKLLNLMHKSCTTDEQKKILLAIDEMVGSMMGNSFDDGVAAGLELASVLKDITSNPSYNYMQLLKDKGVTDSACDSARELIHKHRGSALELSL